jgi:hypothetical protein
LLIIQSPFKEYLVEIKKVAYDSAKNRNGSRSLGLESRYKLPERERNKTTQTCGPASCCSSW